MYRNDRNVDSFNLVNALQPVFRNTAVGYLNTIVKSRMKPLIQSYERWR